MLLAARLIRCTLSARNDGVIRSGVGGDVVMGRCSIYGHRTTGVGVQPNGATTCSKDIVLASQRGTNVFLQALVCLPAKPESTGRAVGPGLATQLEAWHQRSTEPALPPAALRLGMTCWTRLHGILSLELDGHLHATKVDPELHYHAEVDDLIG